MAKAKKPKELQLDVEQIEKIKQALETRNGLEHQIFEVVSSIKKLKDVRDEWLGQHAATAEWLRVEFEGLESRYGVDSELDLDKGTIKPTYVSKEQAQDW